MMEWRDENDKMEDDRRMRNQVIKKSILMRGFFKEKRTNLKYKKTNRVYTIHGRD